MFDHVKFGVSDYAASKAFFLQALAPLGVTLVGEGEPSYAQSCRQRRCFSMPSIKVRKNRRRCTLPFAPTAASRSMPSGRRRWPPEERTTARRGYGQTTTPVTTPRL
ncbi:Lactoylglutathione lyase [Klebsiella pneumoniae]|uniref:Lactoylglutathione lyase n=1 Tax=Klebsiella pneumoniae TaxID=573 RepID=A0A377TZ90_KLEPN|nr:Lactoylglutathione lyase [Klebsiella pneumoniae]